MDMIRPYQKVEDKVKNKVKDKTARKVEDKSAATVEDNALSRSEKRFVDLLSEDARLSSFRHIHDVTLSVVHSAVRIEIRISTIIFHVSRFIILNFEVLSFPNFRFQTIRTIVDIDKNLK